MAEKLMPYEAMPIDTAPKDGSAFIGIKGRLAFRTHWQAYYDKWPHQEGGPTFTYGWSYEDGGSHNPWRPTHWVPFPTIAEMKEEANG